MIYFLLPNVHYKIYENLDCIVSENPPKSMISNSLSYYLYEIKYKIDKCEKDWDIYKKYTNPYEYITTVHHLEINAYQNINHYQDHITK